MKAVIIEDEIVAAQNLKRLIRQIDSSIEIVALLQSIEESVEWFAVQPAPDLVFMDIHLSDGSAFSIFNRVEVDCPIIFITAYDQYALNAFEVNSIDYLLKPVNIAELERAIAKHKKLSRSNPMEHKVLGDLFDIIKNQKPAYKSRFLIPYKDKFLSLSADDIAFIFSENKMSNIVSINNQQFHQSCSLDEMYKQLNPEEFFRANRQFIISRKSVKDIFNWFDNKLSIALNVPTPERIIISRARAAEFKQWFTQ